MDKIITPGHVVIDGKQSEPVLVNSGAPKGSLLPPVLFIIFINDNYCVEHNTIRVFFDDTASTWTVYFTGANLRQEI